jgi:hypothetical protein
MLVRYYYVECPGTPGQLCDGGAYASGRAETRDYWTGVLVDEHFWSSGATTCDYCPRLGQFGCDCPEEDHDIPWADARYLVRGDATAGSVWASGPSYDLVLHL